MRLLRNDVAEAPLGRTTNGVAERARPTRERRDVSLLGLGLRTRLTACFERINKISRDVGVWASLLVFPPHFVQVTKGVGGKLQPEYKKDMSRGYFTDLDVMNTPWSSAEVWEEASVLEYGFPTGTALVAPQVLETVAQQYLTEADFALVGEELERVSRDAVAVGFERGLERFLTSDQSSAAITASQRQAIARAWLAMLEKNELPEELGAVLQEHASSLQLVAG